MNSPTSIVLKALIPIIIGCAIWVIFRVYMEGGFFKALLCLIMLAVAYKFGGALVFAASSSLLHFHFNAVGLWLPVISYIWAAATLVVAIMLLQQRNETES